MKLREAAEELNIVQARLRTRRAQIASHSSSGRNIVQPDSENAMSNEMELLEIGATLQGERISKSILERVIEHLQKTGDSTHDSSRKKSQAFLADKLSRIADILVKEVKGEDDICSIRACANLNSSQIWIRRSLRWSKRIQPFGRNKSRRV